MRKAHRILVIALAAGVLGGAGWLILYPGEPLYAGKPLHFWMETLDSVSPGFPPPEPWDELGSGEIPVLIKALEIRDSRWHNIYPRMHRAIWRRLPVSILRRLPRPLDTENIAINALLLIYPKNDEYRTNAAVFRPAIPVLVHLVRTDKSGPIRMMAAAELGFIGAKDEVVTATLVEALNDNSQAVRINATEALRRIDPEAARRAEVKQNNRRVNVLDGNTAEK